MKAPDKSVKQGKWNKAYEGRGDIDYAHNRTLLDKWRARKDGTLHQSRVDIEIAAWRQRGMTSRQSILKMGVYR